MRFKDVQVADFGSTISEESSYALDGDAIGTLIFRSPEAHIQMRWGTATDIWSFGAMVGSFKMLLKQKTDIGRIQLISLIYGEGFHIFRPDVSIDHDDYDLKILMKHHQCFGPFPVSYEEIADQERLAVLVWVMEGCTKETLKPFRQTTEKEISRQDREFICKIMRLDPRDRPTAAQLLQDKWFAKS